ncbi:GLPGLI family protein [Pedobacter sp. ok626]|uniref:GLPGLI family protein n=1 Tax=Pedobacter sp. ok626 TaxID=1761882 RepID=UPI000883EB67|nr:GLPGLI family protein [Pedobacter sp. ok626]SDL65788.1 GLPGLI family protein [Pedobacter sp. ok626]
MKKTILLIISCFHLLAAISVRAQSTDTVIARVTYKFSHIRDTTDLTKVYTHKMVLILGANSSVYKSHALMLSDSTTLQYLEFTKNLKRMSHIGKNRTGDEIYIDYKKKKAARVDAMVENYYYDIDFPIIKWKIGKETATISGYKCEKATGEWKGRIYEAWFTRQLPYHLGPWKLSGLPGLIINASDLKKQVKFEFIEYEKYVGPKWLVELHKEHINTTLAEHIKKKEEYLDDPIAFTSKLIPDVKMVRTGPAYKRAAPINNPIELDNKK